MAAAAGELRVPMTLQKARLKTEEKTLDFEFEVVNVQFNSRGRYALRLTAENPLLEGAGAGVRLRVNDGEAVWSDTGTTDVVEQSDLNEICSFQRRKFIFTLPKGFCKNDKNHDARLHIEALRFRGTADESGRRVGEAFFAIYPRTNQPRMNLFASRDEDLYRYSDVVALLRVGSDRLARHCGRLAFAVSFHEHRPPASAPQQTPFAAEGGRQAAVSAERPPAPCQSPDVPLPSHLLHTPESTYRSLPTEGHVCSPKQPLADPELSSSPKLPGDSADEHLSSSSSSVPAPRQLLSRSSFHLSSPGYSPDLTSSAVQVPESPAGEQEVARVPEAGQRHVAREGMEAVTVTLHGASNLPATREGRAPRPYVIVKPSGDEQQQEVRVTRASSEPTHSPTWEEEVTVEINAKDVGWEALTLTVADQGTKEALAIYRLPVRHLQPFHHYHCRLALPRQKDPVGTSLYVTVVRKGSVIPRSEGMDYAALEVLLQGMTAPLAGPRGALVAVASIVTNVRAYEEGMAKRPAARPGVALTTVTFPEPSAADFSLGHAADRGCPQMTHPAGPPEKPTWNTSFLFQGRDGATIFSEDAALAIEYYPYKARHRAEDHVRGRPGRWALPAARQIAETGYFPQPSQQRRPPQPGCHLPRDAPGDPRAAAPSRTAGTPRAGRAAGGAGRAAAGSSRQRQHPQQPASGTGFGATPACPYAAAPQLGPASSWQRAAGHGWPAAPGAEAARGPAPWGSGRQAPMIWYYRPFSSSLHQGDASLPPADAVAGILPEKPPYPRETAAAPEEQRCQDGARDQQDQEATNYRLALERMADDILSLRQHVASLEVENSNLRRSLAMHEDPGRTLLSDIDVDVMTRAEILDRIATLKCKLASGTVEMRSLKDRVQQLQNELIRKNDQEKDLVMLQRAHQQQQAVLRRYEEKVAKMKGLEETVRQQEKVIETMERMLEERLSEAGRSTQKPAGEALARELYDALLAENRRLREELARPRHPSPPVAPPPQALPDVFSGSEKVSLLAKLEKEQARSRVLESQLEEASRRWGREKQELSTRLLEQDHGFRGWSSSFAHDLAMKMPLDPTAPVKRHQTLDPLP